MNKFIIRASSAYSLATSQTQSALPAGAKTYCETWLKGQIYDKKKTFSSKYTEKGTLGEAEAIELVRERFGYFSLEKNTERKTNEYFTGEIDVLCPDGIITDTKVSWDCFSFPLFDKELDPRYYAQGQVYMSLWDVKKYRVAYCLVDMPEEMLVKQSHYYCKDNELELTEDILDEIRKANQYSLLPIEKRIKIFEFEYDPAFILFLKDRVLKARKYIETLKTNLK